MQLHEPAPFGDWAGADEDTRRQVMTEALWQSIDAVGVNAVLLNALEDLGWITDLAGRFPDRVATVPMYGRDTEHTGDAEVMVADLCEKPGAVAIRFAGAQRVADREYDAAFAACEKRGMPIWLEVMGGVSCVDRVARSFPELQIVVDHIGLNQPPYQARDDPTWRDLPIVESLAQYENVAVKVCAPVSMSDEEFPWSDAWPAMVRLLEAFRPQRLGWASDIQRTRGRSGFQVRLLAAATADAPAHYTWAPDAHVPGPPPAGPDYVGKHTYMDSLAFFLYNDQLSAAEKEQILGRTTRRIHKWPAGGS